jgi:hypothetical protein
MNCEEYFANKGYWDLLPLAWDVAGNGYSEDEMIAALSLLIRKELRFPAIRNRRRWFEVVYREKLEEARTDTVWLSLRSGSK